MGLRLSKEVQSRVSLGELLAYIRMALEVMKMYETI